MGIFRSHREAARATNRVIGGFYMVIAIWTVVLLTVVSIAAGLIPAKRASRIDPILALRTD